MCREILVGLEDSAGWKARPHRLGGETMLSNAQTAPASRWMLWGGYIASAIPVLMLLFSGVLKLVKPDFLVKEFDRLGYGENLALVIGILEIGCTVVYLIPRTSILGAILLT